MAGSILLCQSETTSKQPANELPFMYNIWIDVKLMNAGIQNLKTNHIHEVAMRNLSITK